MTAIIEDSQKQAIDSSVIILYELEYAEGSFARFFPGKSELLQDITFRDTSGAVQTYTALPMEIEGFDISSDGAYSRPVMTVSSMESIFSTEIGGLSFDDLVGKRITRRSTLRKYLADVDVSVPPVEFPRTVYIIDRLAEKTAINAKFELAAPFDLAGIQLPRRVIIGGSCPWKYTGASAKKYDATGLVWTDVEEADKEGGCNWRRDSILTVGGTEYTLYMNSSDEYILPLTGITGITPAEASTVTNYQEDNYYWESKTLNRIDSDGISSSVSITVYWQCLSDTTVDPSEISSLWRPIRIYDTYSTLNNYYGYNDKRFNSYTVKDNKLWQVKRISQLASTHSAVQENIFWTQGDACGKTLTSCKSRFQADINSQGGFQQKRNSSLGLPYGGYPGVIQRR